MPTYFMYCRKSSEAEDRQILSIDCQVTELKRYATHRCFKIAAVLIEAKSAKAPGARPVINSVMQQLYRSEADGILCRKLDRLARNPVDGGFIVWAMKQHGLTVATPFQIVELTHHHWMSHQKPAHSVQTFSGISDWRIIFLSAFTENASRLNPISTNVASSPFASNFTIPARFLNPRRN
jgi:hypothetical protein